MNYDESQFTDLNSLHPDNILPSEIIEFPQLEPLEQENEDLYNENCELKERIKELENILAYRKKVNAEIVKLCQDVCGDNTYIFNKLKEIK